MAVARQVRVGQCARVRCCMTDCCSDKKRDWRGITEQVGDGGRRKASAVESDCRNWLGILMFTLILLNPLN